MTRLSIGEYFTRQGALLAGLGKMEISSDRMISVIAESRQSNEIYRPNSLTHDEHPEVFCCADQDEPCWQHACSARPGRCFEEVIVDAGTTSGDD